MQNITISINPIAEFTTATPGKKRSIVKQQLNPPKVLIARYRTARASMTKSVKNGFSEKEIVAGIDRLQGRVPKSDFHRNDIKNSIDALRCFLKLRFPEEFKPIMCSFPKADVKSITLAGVNVLVAPDLIMRWTANGKTYIGGIKFHISRSGMFDIENSRCVAAGLRMFLEKNVAGDSDIVDPRFCLSVEVFGERVICAPTKHDEYIAKLLEACQEINRMLKAA